MSIRCMPQFDFKGDCEHLLLKTSLLSKHITFLEFQSMINN